MTKGTAMLIGLALALAPGSGSAQQVGASFTVVERPAQPELHAAAATVPAGWAYSVTRGSEAGGAEAETHVTRSRRTEVAMPVSAVSSARGRETVTWTFVPL